MGAGCREEAKMPNKVEGMLEVMSHEDSGAISISSVRARLFENNRY